MATLYGTSNPEALPGTSAPDSLYGGDGADTLYGGGASDRIEDVSDGNLIYGDRYEGETQAATTAATTLSCPVWATRSMPERAMTRSRAAAVPRSTVARATTPSSAMTAQATAEPTWPSVGRAPT